MLGKLVCHAGAAALLMQRLFYPQSGRTATPSMGCRRFSGSLMSRSSEPLLFVYGFFCGCMSRLMALSVGSGMSAFPPLKEAKRKCSPHLRTTLLTDTVEKVGVFD